jgi:hypothetical protein
MTGRVLGMISGRAVDTVETFLSDGKERVFRRAWMCHPWCHLNSVHSYGNRCMRSECSPNLERCVGAVCRVDPPL